MIMSIDQVYKNFAMNVLENGEKRETRNGETRALFGTTLSFDMAVTGLPLISLRKMYLRGIVGEFRGFLQDAKSVQEFEALGCPYWQLWAEPDGSLNLDYPPREQLSAVIKSIMEDPTGRRHIINLWDHTHLDELSLPCCHFNYQFYVRKGRYLDMVWTQRSVDIAVGLPSDFILAALYLDYIGFETGLKPGRITMNFGDSHIYEEHIDQMHEMLERVSSHSFIDWYWEEGVLKVKNYAPHEPIKFLLKG